MPGINLSGVCFLLAASLPSTLAAQNNLVVQGLEAYNKGDYVTAERNFRGAVDQGGDRARPAHARAGTQGSD